MEAAGVHEGSLLLSAYRTAPKFYQEFNTETHIEAKFSIIVYLTP